MILTKPLKITNVATGNEPKKVLDDSDFAIAAAAIVVMVVMTTLSRNLYH